MEINPAYLREVETERDRLSADLEIAYQTCAALVAEREADRDEAATTYAAMRAEIEALRCRDLDAYFDGELSHERRAAFELHLGRCATCQAGLDGLMQEVRIADAPEREP